MFLDATSARQSTCNSNQLAPILRRQRRKRMKRILLVAALLASLAVLSPRVSGQAPGQDPLSAIGNQLSSMFDPNQASCDELRRLPEAWRKNVKNHRHCLLLVERPGLNVDSLGNLLTGGRLLARP